MNLIFISCAAILAFCTCTAPPLFVWGLNSDLADQKVQSTRTLANLTRVKIQLRNSSLSSSKWEFVCSLSEAQRINKSFSLQSIRLESCDNQYNCRAGLQEKQICSAKEMESCIFHKSDGPPVAENKLKVHGKVTCTVKRNKRSYDSQDFYFRGLSRNYYLVSESPPLEERLALRVKKSKSIINQTEVSCRALYFFYQASSLTLTMVDRHGVESIVKDVKKSDIADVRGWTHSFEKSVTWDIQSFTCSVRLHEPNQLVNATYVVREGERPSTPISATTTTTAVTTATTTTTTTETATTMTSTKTTTATTFSTVSFNKPSTTPQLTSRKGKHVQRTTAKTKITIVSKSNHANVTKATSPADPANQSFVITIGSTMSLVFLAVCLFIGYCGHRYFTMEWICCLRKSPSELENHEMTPVRSGLEGGFVIPRRYLISPEDLSLDYSHRVSQGQFSTLYQGHLKLSGKRSVLVKVNNVAGDAGEITSLMNDVQMRILAGETNENITSILGAYFNRTAGKVYIAMESAPRRNMREFLTNKNMPIGQMKILNMPPHEMIDTFCTWLKGVSQGLEFLHGKKIVHGNLAAENILVSLQNTSSVSIIGFSHSQQLIGNSSYFVNSRSWMTGWETSGWRWMPMESLRYMEFSKESDIWSFGVLMWEIFSLGAIPYSKYGCSNLSMEFIQKLEFGRRLSQPQLASKKIYRKMEGCWSRYGKDRPKASHLYEYFNEDESNLINYVNLAK